MVGRMENAHNAGINVVKVVDPTTVATGDDDGTIKLWDLRTAKAVMEISEHEDFIADMELAEDGRTLLVAG